MEPETTEQTTESWAQAWVQGMRDGLPVCMGYFAVAFAFGIQAKAVGMTAFQGTLLSLTNLTSAGQFAGLGIIAAGGTYLEMALAQLALNARYCLMSCTLSQKLPRGISPIHRFLMAYDVTDEIFALNVCQEGPIDPFYYYGMMSVAIPGWTMGTLFGVVSGGLLPASVISALGLAIYGMFVAIVVPAARDDKLILKVVLCAMAVSALFHYTPLLREISPGFRVIIITVLIAGTAAILFPVEPSETYLKEGETYAN